MTETRPKEAGDGGGLYTTLEMRQKCDLTTFLCRGSKHCPPPTRPTTFYLCPTAWAERTRLFCAGPDGNTSSRQPPPLSLSPDGGCCSGLPLGARGRRTSVTVVVTSQRKKKKKNSEKPRRFWSDSLLGGGPAFGACAVRGTRLIVILANMLTH